MKYICNDCNHEFDGLSFVNKCEACGSGNISRKGQKLVTLFFLQHQAN